MRAEEIIRTQREKILADLFVKYEKASAQLTSTLSAVDRESLKNQLAQIEHEIRDQEAQLRTLEMTEPGQPHQEAWIKERLRTIDFTEAIEHVRATLQSFSSAGGAALFLLENRHPLAGDCCLGRIRDLLAEETHPEHFREYPVEFSVGMPLNEYGLLQRLGEHVGIQADLTNLQESARAIIETICAPLQSGAVVLLVVNKWDLLLDLQERVLRQFLDLFWLPFVGKFPLAQKRRIKLVTIITSDGPLAPSCHAVSLCCPQTAFTVQNIQPLPLRYWTYQEIQAWLDRFSGWDAPQIDRFAHTLYQSSLNGLPQLVYNALLQEFASA